MSTRFALSLILLFVGIGLAIFRLSEFSEPFHVHASWAFQDFLGVVYYPTVAFLTGENPYNAAAFINHYPVYFAFPPFLPAVFLVHLPFALLSQPLSTLLYFLTVLGLTATLSYASFKIADLPSPLTSVMLVFALILISRPGHSNLLLGQTAIQFSLSAYMAYYFAKRSTLLGAIGLVFCVLKPTFGLPLALLLIAEGHMRLVLFAATLAVAINVPFVFMLVEAEGSLSALIQSSISSFPAWASHEQVEPATSATRIDLSSLIGRTTGVKQTLAGQLSVLFGTIGLAAFASARCAQRAIAGIQHLLLGITLITILLCVYHKVYDLVILTAPFVAMVGRRFPQSFYRTRHYAISLVLLCFLALDYLAGDTIMKLLVSDTDAWKLLASANTIALLLLFVTWLHAIRAVLVAESDGGLRHVPKRGLTGNVEH